ncbi:MAG: hypothetical protein ABH890_04740 [Bacillota bacterium]
MSYQEKRIITNIASLSVFLGAYCTYIFVIARSGTIVPDDFHFWAETMLIFIAVGIVAMIIIQIIFHILLTIAIAVKEKKCDEEINNILKSTMVEDEMDKLIGLKSSKIGYIIAAVGFVASLVLLVMDFSPAVMLNILFLSYCLGAMSEGLLSLYFYRKGVKNG